jgi:hypothetical protein
MTHGDLHEITEPPVPDGTDRAEISIGSDGNRLRGWDQPTVGRRVGGGVAGRCAAG